MKNFVLLVVAFLTVISAQPASYSQDGSYEYKSVGLNFGHDFILPINPEINCAKSSSGFNFLLFSYKQKVVHGY